MNSKLLIPTDNEYLDAQARKFGLSNQERLFAEAYIASGFSFSEAHEAAGYKGKSRNGYDRLNNPKIQNYLAVLVKESLDKLGVDKDHVIRVLADIAFFDVTSLYCEITNEPIPLGELSQQARNAIRDVLTSSSKDPKTKERTTRVTGYVLHDKSKALEMLGKHFGIFEKDNLQSKAVINQQYNITWN